MKEKYPFCPICKWKTSQYTLPQRRKTETEHHITSKARNELWAKEFDKKVKTPHLDYFRKQIKGQRIEIKYKVNFDI